jgi:RHS repeat-associated protein
VGPDGSLYIADYGNGRVRRVGPDGVITTVAGDGTQGFSGDGGPATAARLWNPVGVAVGPHGSLYIADIGNDRIRRVGPDGIISTVAGSGYHGFAGDGGPATAAWLYSPSGVAVGPNGSLYIADWGNYRVRRVEPDGVITTVAGDGTQGFSGDGGPATAARLIPAGGVAVGADGSLYVADIANNRIRQIALSLPRFSLSDRLIPSQDGSEVYAFNPAGRHLRTLDALTNAVRYQFSYDGAGHLTTVTDGAGNVTTIERDAAGNSTALVAPGGQRTTFTLTGDGLFASISDPAGNAVRLTYGAGGLLSTLADPRGNVHTMTYDVAGRLTRDEDPVGGFKALSRREDGRNYTVTVTTTGGQTSTYRVENLTTGAQRRVATEASGLQTVEVIGTDDSRTFTYPDGTTVALHKGPDPRWGMLAPVVTSLVVTTPADLTSTITETRTAALTDPGNMLSLRTLTDTVTINGRAYRSVFDAVAHTITATSPSGRQEVTTLDALGRVVLDQVAGIDPLAYAYDGRGRLTSVMQGAGAGARALTFAYNGDNTLSSVTDPLGNVGRFTYDAAGRVTQATRPDGEVLTASYDAAGNLTALTPPGRPAHTFAYTPVSQVASYTAPDLGAGLTQTTYTYCDCGRLTQATLPDGQAVGLGYDSAGRLAGLTLPTGQYAYGYDPLTGNLTSLTAPGGVGMSYAYDGGLLTGTTWTGPVAGSVTRTYDRDFRTSSLSVNGGTLVAFQYNSDGLLTGAGGLSLSYNAQTGLLTGTTLGSVSDSVSYDRFGQEAGYSASQGAGALYGVQYTRDLLGRITQKVETVGGTITTDDYAYDAAGRLTEVRKDASVVAVYMYDANGNRLSADGPADSATGTYDAQDRLLSYGGASYTYSPNGEILSKTEGGQTTSYRYDARGHLVHVDLPDGTRIDYLVDTRGRRVGKKVDGVLVQGFLYQDGLRPVAELDGAGNVVVTFVYGSRVNVPDYLVKGGVTYRILSDQLGSPRLVVNAATGQVAQRLDYDAWGVTTVVSEASPGFQPFGFAGGLWDRDTNLVRFGARDYDPTTGRWTSKDASRFGGGPNFYRYANNDPVNYVDLTGHMPEEAGGLRNDTASDRAAWNSGAGAGVLAFLALAARPLGFLLAAGVGIASDKDLWKIPLLGGLPRTGPMDAVRSRFPNGDCRTLSRELVASLGEGQLIEMAPVNGTRLPHGWEVHSAVELPGGGIMDPLLGATFPSAEAWQRAIVGDGTVLISRSPYPPIVGPPIPGENWDALE